MYRANFTKSQRRCTNFLVLEKLDVTIGDDNDDDDGDDS